MNIKIRPLEVKDAYISVNWRNDPSIWLHTTFKSKKKIFIEDELKWIRQVTTDPSCKRFAILADDVYIGNVYLTGIENSTAEFHIFIGDKNYWGKGIAKVASKLAIDFGKNKLKLNTIVLKVKNENKPALSIYKSLGFLESGFENGFIKMELKLSIST